MDTAIQWGDFTTSAHDYSQRPPHSPALLRTLAAGLRIDQKRRHVVDLCAGTGNLTATLAALNLKGWAVEPEAVMRDEARRLHRGGDLFEWCWGTAEESGLNDKSANWIVIGNAFQFLDAQRTLKECNRILRPGGFLTVLWNPRDLLVDAFQRSIDELVRASSTAISQTFTNAEKAIEPIVASPYFVPFIYCDRVDWHEMSPETFMATWRSAHYVPSQIGRTAWLALLEEIRARVGSVRSLRTAWRTRAWTYKVTKN
ncbi:class I SAM-dependent methyltransferase [Bradyrhizobium sp. CB82]|uniref:class I SAM-dependent methyltransferase n=1 Tax=Bradyrhizobium sp. CB82 TaxID=3039159 RepID=UPI0024B236B5|nr:class I SAM-dependent methyltransferase [Bradyrhizobium sp. CB82]WFU40194.1 class I SAM-dependent methyltransferase [Bradyrhizobium sp. CB82]